MLTRMVIIDFTGFMHRSAELISDKSVRITDRLLIRIIRSSGHTRKVLSQFTR